MDELISTMIVQLPNVAVAVMALYWLGRRLDRLLERMDAMLTMLLEHVIELHEAETAAPPPEKSKFS